MSHSDIAKKAKRSSEFPGLGRIDVHHHCFPGTIAELAPEFANASNVSFGVGFTGHFPANAEDHLRFMDEVGIQTAVIVSTSVCPMPGGLRLIDRQTPSIKNTWHQDFSPKNWVQLCDASLQAQLGYVSYNPLRFGCFALLPLPHIEETIEFIRKASALPVQPDGWAITTQIGNRYLGDPLFEPVWEELEKLGSTVFVHPADTMRPPNLDFGPFLQEFPFDTCRAITSVIHSGLLIRHPNIKLLFSHNGGAFPFLADRIGAQHIDEMIAKNNHGLRLRQILSTKNIYMDTSISSAMQFPLLKDLGVPTSHLLYATDFPYTARNDSTGCYQVGYDAPKQSGLFDDETMEDIVRNNALRLFPRLAKEFAHL